MPPIRYRLHGGGHGSLGHGADQRQSFSISSGPLRTQTSFKIGISTLQQLLTECKNKLFIAYQSIFAVHMGGQVVGQPFQLTISTVSWLLGPGGEGDAPGVCSPCRL